MTTKVRKLYLSDYLPEEGLISYSVENEAGDRIDIAVYISEDILKYNFKTMDLFLLSYLPKAMTEVNLKLVVMGPVSAQLVEYMSDIQNYIIDNFLSPIKFYKIEIEYGGVINGPIRDYSSKNIQQIIHSYVVARDINKTLSETFNIYS